VFADFTSKNESAASPNASEEEEERGTYRSVFLEEEREREERREEKGIRSLLRGELQFWGRET